MLSAIAWQRAIEFLCIILLLISNNAVSTAKAADLLPCVQHYHKPRSLTVHHHLTSCPKQQASLDKSSRRRQRDVIPPPPQQQQPSSSANMFVFDVTCISVSDEECDKANNTIIKAGQLISSAIRLKLPIYVNATYLPFCKELNSCATNGEVDIGQAFPAVSYLMTDQSDNTTRMYPQALLKQYTKLDAQPDWSSFDINAQFNSDIDWYFEGDGDAITDSETDFLRNVVHELVHGLGFVTAWSDKVYQKFAKYAPNLGKFLTPMPLNPPNELAQVSENVVTEKGAQPFWGFVEFPLDKLLMATSNNGSLSSLTAVTRTLNLWGNGNVMFASMVDMVNAWCASGDMQAEAEALYQQATNGLDLYAAVPDGTKMWMETSLQPFADGSSLSHVDEATYLNTDDYLMVYSAQRGVSLQSLNQKYPLGPLGPNLLRVLAAMGYVIRPNPNTTTPTTIQPPLKFWEPPADLVGTDTNPTPAVSSFTSGPARIPSATATADAEKNQSSPSLLTLPPYTILLLWSCLLLSYIV